MLFSESLKLLSAAVNCTLRRCSCWFSCLEQFTVEGVFLDTNKKGR